MTETDDPDDVSYKTRTRADSMIVYSTVSGMILGGYIKEKEIFLNFVVWIIIAFRFELWMN